MYKSSNQKSKSTTVLFFSYETITLKLYLEIVRSLDFKKLIVTGAPTLEECQKQWDSIIQRCAESNGGLDYVGFIDLSQRYGYLLQEYNVVKAWITTLWFKIDDKIIEQLTERGYNIITTKDNPKYDNTITISENYKRSLIAALQRSENLVTKLKMTANELRLMLDGKEGGRQEMMFDEIMAYLQLRGLKIEDDLKLSRYIELLKIMNKSSKEEVNG